MVLLLQLPPQHLLVALGFSQFHIQSDDFALEVVDGFLLLLVLFRQGVAVFEDDSVLREHFAALIEDATLVDEGIIDCPIV